MEMEKKSGKIEKILVFFHGIGRMENGRSRKLICLIEKKNKMIENVFCIKFTLMPLLHDIIK